MEDQNSNAGPVQTAASPTKRTRRESGNPSDWVVVNFDPSRCEPPSLEVELQRLKSLQRYQLLDTPPQECYQRLTAMVARALDVPIALITLVDLGRMWTLAGTGVPLDQGPLELPRQESICTHTILSREGFFDVKDISQDEKFCNNEFMKNAGLTFYAGAPLISPDGCRVGAVCVVDSKSHDFQEKEKQFLKDIAATVVELMEQNKKLRDAEKKVEMLCHLGGAGAECSEQPEESAGAVPPANKVEAVDAVGEG